MSSFTQDIRIDASQLCANEHGVEDHHVHHRFRKIRKALLKLYSVDGVNLSVFSCTCSICNRLHIIFPEDCSHNSTCARFPGMGGDTARLYHLVPAARWEEAVQSQSPYYPSTYEQVPSQSQINALC